ncbi:MAG: hypothetical protein JRJ69_00490 [Deltaproteobacteria bacterium]|nr:hypothetical protein [Deltaproteobacteria bacterium]
MVARLSDLVREHMSPPTGMLFYNSLESVYDDINILGYWSVIKRAWNELKLDGVLCIDGRPVLYLKEHGRPFNINERIRLQKLFWNQGVSNILVLAEPTTVYIYSGLGTPPRDESDNEARRKGLVEELAVVDYVHRIQFLYHDLETGHYYDTHQRHFDPEQSVTGKSMTGSTYAALPYGPQLNNYRDLIDEIKCASEISTKPLTPEEKQIIAMIVEIFPHEKLVYDSAHKEKIWKQKPTGAIIPYSDSFELTGL